MKRQAQLGAAIVYHPQPTQNYQVCEQLLSWKGIAKNVDIQAMAAACLDRPARQDSTDGKRYWFGHSWCITLEKDSLLTKIALSPQHGMVPHLSMFRY